MAAEAGGPEAPTMAAPMPEPAASAAAFAGAQAASAAAAPKPAPRDAGEVAVVTPVAAPMATGSPDGGAGAQGGAVRPPAPDGGADDGLDFDAGVAMAEEWEQSVAQKQAEEPPKPPEGEVQATGAAAAPSAATAASPEDDKLEFTGLRITRRKCDPAAWRAAIAGHFPPRRIMPFTRLSELGSRQRQEYDRVVVGVLYDRSGEDRFANGEHYLRWYLTDLAQPRPRLMALHLRFKAFAKWRGGHEAAEARRGAIFAVMNPVLVEGDRENEAGMVVARVDKPMQLFKLGECPSIGTCDVKGCRWPCNLDRHERICAQHLTRIYAEKSGRIVAGGGMDASLKALLKASRGPSQQKANMRAAAEAALDLDEGGAEEQRAESAKKARTMAALQLDDRRFSHNRAKEDYVRSVIGLGTIVGEAPVSRVPVLGRGLAEEDGLEFDPSTLASSELRKAERMLELRAAERENAPARGERRREPSPDNTAGGLLPPPPPKRSRAHGAPSAAEKPPPKPPALSELVQKLECRRLARRTGGGAAAGPTGTRVTPQRSAPAQPTPRPEPAPHQDAAAAAAERPDDPKTSAPASSSSSRSPAVVAEGESPESLEHRVETLVALLRGGGDEDIGDAEAARVAGALRAAERLPQAALSGPASRRLHETLARLAAAHGMRSDIQRLAKSVRRRLCLMEIASAAVAADAKSAGEEVAAAALEKVAGTEHAFCSSAGAQQGARAQTGIAVDGMAASAGVAAAAQPPEAASRTLGTSDLSGSGRLPPAPAASPDNAGDAASPPTAPAAPAAEEPGRPTAPEALTPPAAHKVQEDAAPQSMPSPPASETSALLASAPPSAAPPEAEAAGAPHESSEDEP